MSYTFRPPTVQRPMGTGSLWGRIKYDQGITVLKMDSGAYQQVSVYDPDLPDVATVYLGGHVHTVSDAEAALLTAAGYGAFLTAVP